MNRASIAAAAWLAVWLPGCLSMEREPPNQQRYVLDVHREAVVEPRGTAVLEVRRFHVDTAYSQNAFVYRTSDTEAETDYYNEFLVPPGLALSEQSRRWLGDSGVFSVVQGTGGALAPTHVLEADVTAIHGDYRGVAPAAVIELQVVVLAAGSGAEVILHKRYAGRIPLEGEGPATLAIGFGQALRAILEALEQDLRAVLGA